MQLLNPTNPEKPTASGPVTGNSLNVTRVTGMGATITALGAAATGLFAVKSSDAVAVQVCKVASVAVVVAAALLVIAAVVVADIWGRSHVAAGPPPVAMTNGGSAASKATQPHVPTVPVKGEVALWVQVKGQGQSRFLVITARGEAADITYLVSRADEQPRWVASADVETFSVGAHT